MDLQTINLQAFTLPSLVLMTLTSVFLLATSNWRFSLIALFLQYAAVFIVIYANWSLQLSTTILFSGWIACIVLVIAQFSVQASTKALNSDISNSSERKQATFIQGFLEAGGLFRLLAGGLVILAIQFIAPLLGNWIADLGPVQAFGGLILMGMGLLKLGFTDNTLAIFIGLLTVLAGFEIIYSVIESSALVVGLLAVVTLGLALTGSYMLSVIQKEATT